MEIHAPHGRVESARDVALHLAIVTVGILIALVLEQTVEWYHHRELAVQARENIRNELRQNKKELDAFLGRSEEIRKHHLQVLAFIRDVTTRGKSDITSLQLNFNIAQLRDTNWTTAQTVGALGYLPYEEVEKFSAVYELQGEYARLQRRSLDLVVAAMAMFADAGDPNKVPKSELEAERGKVLDTIASLTAQTQIGQGLDKAYSEVSKSDK